MLPTHPTWLLFASVSKVLHDRCWHCEKCDVVILEREQVVGMLEKCL